MNKYISKLILLALIISTVFVTDGYKSRKSYIASSNISRYGTYTRKSVKTARGRFLVRYIAADMKNPYVNIATDTATASKCKNNCPVRNLKTFYSRNNGFAAINGTYFCPASYAGCKKQKGFYFWRVYNTRHGNMLNQSNGYTRYDPLVVVGKNKKIYYFHHALDFKKVLNFELKYGTKVQAAISGTELVYKKRITVPKKKLDSKQKYAHGYRGALGIKGTKIYFVIAKGATVLDMAAVMRSLKMDYAINLDGGGSSALLFDGKYKVGPGRNIPNAIIFTKTTPTSGYGY